MEPIVLRAFMGISPGINPRLLAPTNSQIAENTRFEDGSLQAWPQKSFVVTPTKPGTKQTIYRFGENLSDETTYWLTWTTDVSVVRAPIDEDTSERTYYTGDGYPKVTDNALALTSGTNYPVTSYRLGLPQPDVSTTTASVTGTPTNANDTATTVAYVLTYVSSFGEESAPSTAIGPYTFKPGQTVAIVNMPVAPSGAYNVTSKRLYRSNTGNAGTNYQLVAEIPVATANYNDSAAADALENDVVQTWNWFQLDDEAQGLCLMANGIGAAFKGNTVFLSVPFALYAWPDDYRLSVESKIVGIAAFGQSLFVGTQSFPYVISGVDPSAMAPVKLGTKAACASKRSIVSMMDGVIYASKKGLWYVSAGGIQNLSDGFFNPTEWRKYKPESFHAYEWEGRYIAFFDTGTKQGALVFDFPNKQVFELTEYCTAAYNDPIKDRLYMAQGADINSLATANTLMTAKWRSKVFRYADDVDPGWLKVEADSYPVQVKVYVDGVEVADKTVNDNKTTSLPRARGREVQVEVFPGDSNVTAVIVAETADAIAEV